jgi:hypothetical protein
MINQPDTNPVISYTIISSNAEDYIIFEDIFAAGFSEKHIKISFTNGWE